MHNPQKTNEWGFLAKIASWWASKRSLVTFRLLRPVFGLGIVFGPDIVFWLGIVFGPDIVFWPGIVFGPDILKA